MHITLLNDDIVPSAKGGSATVADWERRALKKRGHQVSLITTHQDLKRGELIDISDDVGRIMSMHISYPLRKRHRMCLKMEKVSKKLDELLGQLKPDIVHAHTIHTYLTYDALRIARRHAEKVFMTAHDTFLVSFDRIRKMNPGRMHSWNHLFAVGRRYWPLRNQEIKKAIRDSGTTVISISNVLDKFLKKNGIEPTTVVPNGIPISSPASSESIEKFRIQYNLSGPTILYGGRINADKGICVLLHVMEKVLTQVPNAQLLVVGEENRLKPHLIKVSNNVRRATKATDWLPQEQMSQAYGAVDVITTPSIYFDAFNLMNIEAMIAHKPVVGTCFGGTAEIVDDGVTGYVRNPLDTDAFSATLIELLTKKDLAKSMGEAGRKRAEETYSIDHHVDALLKLFM